MIGARSTSSNYSYTDLRKSPPSLFHITLESVSQSVSHQGKKRKNEAHATAAAAADVPAASAGFMLRVACLFQATQLRSNDSAHTYKHVSHT